MDLMGMVNSAIASPDTEADKGLVGSLLGSLNNAPVENDKIGGIASNLQGLLQSRSQQKQEDAGSLMGVLQTVAATGAVEKLMGSDQVNAIAQKAGAQPDMVKAITPLVAQFLVKGSNAKGGGLIQKVLSGEVDLGQMASLISAAKQFM